MLILICGFAFRRGRRYERIGAAICLGGSAATLFVHALSRVDYVGIAQETWRSISPFWQDFVAIALRSDRFWPLWIAGFQLTSSTAHLMKAIDQSPDSAGLRRGRAILELSDSADSRSRLLASVPADANTERGGIRLRLRGGAAARIGLAMTRRKKSHQSPGPASRPRLWGKHAVAAALDNPDRKVLRAWATRDAMALMQFPKEVPVTLAEAPDLGRLVPGDAPHQGMVIEVEPLEDIWLDGLLHEAPEQAVLLVLDQVTDPHNVGAILRSTAAFGAVGIVTQDRHSPPESGALAKAASGALERVPWVRVVNLARALDEIGDAGFWRIGLTGDADTDLKQALGPPRVALVLGAEGPGLRPNTREHCDALARLPITAAVESLNVSNAAAIALYAASIA